MITHLELCEPEFLHVLLGMKKITVRVPGVDLDEDYREDIEFTCGQWDEYKVLSSVKVSFWLGEENELCQRYELDECPQIKKGEDYMELTAQQFEDLKNRIEELTVVK